MAAERGRPEFLIDNPTPDLGSMPLGEYTVVVPLGGHQSRPADDLARAVREADVDSVAEACKAFSVTITGTYEGLDGQPVAARIPVKDDTTFTPRELTRNHPGLFDLYVTSELCDQLQSRGIEALDEATIEFLTQTADFLEKSPKGDER